MSSARERWDGRGVFREVVDYGNAQYATVTKKVDTGYAVVTFALPPDSEPTGRLWAKLEEKLAGWRRFDEAQ